MNSLAGTPGFVAPEIMRIAQYQQREEYTPSVDLYSLGKMLSLVLWRTKISNSDAGPKILVIPTNELIDNDPRVPDSALRLIDTLTQERPEARGTAEQLAAHPFFALCHVGRHTLPALDFVALERCAER